MTPKQLARDAGTSMQYALAPAPPGRSAGGSAASRQRKRQEMVAGYLFILPLFAGTALFYFYPIFRTIYLSFNETGFFFGEEWVGLGQYERLIQDPDFWGALGNSFVYAGISLLGIPIALLFAVMLNQKGLRFKSTYRLLFFLPVVTMPVSVGMMWALMYNGDFGVINQMLGLIGIDGPSWLTSSSTALVAVSVVGVWSILGQNVVILLAGLQSVPNELLEAAALDGAGAVRRFWNVTLPLLSPTTFFVSIITLINALQAFDLIYVMIGPNNPAIKSAQTVVYYFFSEGFYSHNRGYAAAIVCVLFLITLALTAIQFRLQKKWVHYAS